jgi:hypothetical protein
MVKERLKTQQTASGSVRRKTRTQMFCKKLRHEMQCIDDMMLAALPRVSHMRATRARHCLQ